MSKYRLVSFLIISLFFSSLNVAAAEASKTEISEIDQSTAQMFLDAREMLNDWSGELEKLENAEKLINNVLELEPEFLPIYIEKIRLTIMMGWHQKRYREANFEALAIAHFLLETDPNYPKTYVLAGHIHNNLREYGKARKYLSKALDVAPDDPWTYANWAALMEAKGNIPGALNYSKKAFAKSGNNPKALLNALDQIARYGRMTGDTAWVENAVDVVFENFLEPAARLRIAERIMRSTGKRSQKRIYAYLIIARQFEETPDLPEAAYRMGGVFYVNAHVGEEDTILQFAPGDAFEAEQILAKIADNDEFREKVFRMRVTLNVGSRRFEEVQEMIEIAETEAKIPADAIIEGKAYLHFARGEFSESIALYEKLGDKSNTTLIAAYYKTGQKEKRRLVLLEQLEQSPKNARLLDQYAAILMHNFDDAEGAVEYGERALGIQDSSLARYNLGVAYLVRASKRFEQDDHDGARKDYQRSRRLGVELQQLGDMCWKYCNDVRKMELAFQMPK